ncbi:MAG: 1-acyl-sn-glycerol-3-phosphate acyltransferase [Holophagaceae bacterium]|nr:1-acyl-sn-glycerol-3-phosphate acyltransferase [Holophagaceae bacterium]
MPAHDHLSHCPHRITHRRPPLVPAPDPAPRADSRSRRGPHRGQPCQLPGSRRSGRLLPQAHLLPGPQVLFKGFLGWLLPRIQVLPVDRGKGDLASMKRILSLLKEGHRVLIFPEGTRSMDGALQPAEAGIGFIIAKCDVPVVPVRIFGAFECFPRGSSWPRPGRITIVPGPPVDFSAVPSELTGRDRYQACADQVMKALAELRLEA